MDPIVQGLLARGVPLAQAQAMAARMSGPGSPTDLSGGAGLGYPALGLTPHPAFGGPENVSGTAGFRVASPTYLPFVPGPGPLAAVQRSTPPTPPPRPGPAQTAAPVGPSAASPSPNNLIQYDVPGVIGQPTGMSRSPIYTTGNMFAGAPNRGAPGVDPSIQARGGVSPPLPGQSQPQGSPFQGFLSRLTAPPPGQENRQGLLASMPGANQLGALANAAANISRAFGGQGQGNVWQPQSMSPNGFRPQGGWWNGWQGG